MNPLQISEGLPISLSFGLFDSYVLPISSTTLFCFLADLITYRYSLHVLLCRHILADPTSFEEPLLDTTISITLNASTNQLLAVSKLGEGLAGTDVVGQCIKEAKRRMGDVSSVYEF